MRHKARLLVRRAAGRAVRRVESFSASAQLMLVGLAQARSSRSRHPEVILHAGDHKTGTTSIQSVILHERKRLAEQGVDVLRTLQDANGGHHKLVRALHDQSLGRMEARLLRAELARAFPGRALISTEATKRIVVEGHGHRLVDELRAAGAGRVRILLYLRSPAGKANAHYSQMTGAFGLAGATLAEFLPAYASGPAFAFDSFCDLALRDDVELVVRPYTRSARASVVTDFGQAIGVKMGGASEPRSNRSFGPVGLEAMRLLAKEIGTLEAPLRQRLRVRVNAVARALDEEPYWGMSPEQRALLADSDSRTEAFARAAWGRGWHEVVGDEDRPLNVFDPANAVQQAMLEKTLAEMRRTTQRFIG